MIFITSLNTIQRKFNKTCLTFIITMIGGFSMTSFNFYLQLSCCFHGHSRWLNLKDTFRIITGPDRQHWSTRAHYQVFVVSIHNVFFFFNKTILFELELLSYVVSWSFIVEESRKQYFFFRRLKDHPHITKQNVYFP